jgi:tetratricopeptide (TPR) repeat protein
MARNEQHEEPRMSQAKAAALIVLALVAGFWGGYLYRGQADAGLSAARVSTTTGQERAPEAASPREPFADHDLQVHLAVLKKDPNNLRALVQAGNIHYDAQRYAEAIEYYRRALAINPDDVNVRTDLGTAYWYQGNAKQAVAEFQVALKTRPDYAQTLFNLGVVKLHGLNDPEGAIAAWEKLLAANPGYADRDKVRKEVEQARAVVKLKSASR